MRYERYETYFPTTLIEDLECSADGAIWLQPAPRHETTIVVGAPKTRGY